jgi:hypothetical protein
MRPSIARPPLEPSRVISGDLPHRSSSSCQQRVIATCAAGEGVCRGGVGRTDAHALESGVWPDHKVVAEESTYHYLCCRADSTASERGRGRATRSRTSLPRALRRCRQCRRTGHNRSACRGIVHFPAVGCKKHCSDSGIRVVWRLALVAGERYPRQVCGGIVKEKSQLWQSKERSQSQNQKTDSSTTQRLVDPSSSTTSNRTINTDPVLGAAVRLSLRPTGT